MCGIFGIAAGKETGIPPEWYRSVVDELFKLSESRGKESAGVAVLDEREIQIFKQPIPATRMIRSREYRNLVQEKITGNGGASHLNALVGHSRLVTNGTAEKHDNNQPVISEGIVGVHNGIIVNDSELWEMFPDMERRYEVDTEVVLCLTRRFYEETGSLVEAIRKVFSVIYGNASVALLFSDLNVLLLATNNGSMYAYAHEPGKPFIFASEKYILRVLARKKKLHKTLSDEQIIRVQPGNGLLVYLDTLESTPFSLDPAQPNGLATPKARIERVIVDRTPLAKRNLGDAAPNVNTITDRVDLLMPVTDTILNLRRCERCILPETFPFITCVCNFILNDLPITRTDTGICFSYTPLKRDYCYNASMLGAEMLARAYALTGDEELSSMATEAVDFVLSYQKEDGRWYYEIDLESGVEDKQIDFHQGFVLESLCAYMQYTSNTCDTYRTALRKGAKFYREALFYPDGRSLYRLPREWPVDIHNQAQGIITFTKLAEFDPDYLPFAEKIARWTVEHMQDPDGYFYYRKHRFYTNKIPYMRWGQAWMMMGLSYLIATSQVSIES